MDCWPKPDHQCQEPTKPATIQTWDTFKRLEEVDKRVYTAGASTRCQNAANVKKRRTTKRRGFQDVRVRS